jgi:predicted transcriptional regulator
MKYRIRIDIIGQILQVANSGNAPKIKIMYKALLGYDQLKEYLRLLAKRDLLQYDFVNQTFKTTEKGLRFLKFYNEISDIVRESPSSQ